MQRERGELVPVGDALSGMGGPVKAIRDASPQALHHFTQADQVNQLVAAGEADPDLGFMARMLVLCSLPRKLGIYHSSGGRGGVQTRLRNQMRRLFNAHVQLVYKDEHGEASVSSSVADSTAFWWNPKRPDERMLWESKIELGEKFFKRDHQPSGPD